MSSAAKDAATWRPLEGADAQALGRARLMAHHALQWLARFARAYVPPKPDDSHTSLLWDSGLDGFVSRALADGSCLSLRLPDLSLDWHEGRNAALGLSLALDRRRDGEALLWLGEIVAAHGLDGQALEAEAPYEIPDHAVARGAAYDVRGAAAGLAELARWFGNANGVLGRAHGTLVAHKLAAGPVSAWPHHFDLATLAPVPRSVGEDGSVGVGLSSGDDYYAEPYFYVSVYPEPVRAALPKLAPVGHWHTHEFTAAIAPAHAIVAAQDQAAATWDFLEGAVEAAIGLVA